MLADKLAARPKGRWALLVAAMFQTLTCCALCCGERLWPSVTGSVARCASSSWFHRATLRVFRRRYGANETPFCPLQLASSLVGAR